MQKTFAATIIQTLVFVVFCVLVIFNAVQVNHLETLVVEQTAELDNLSRTISNLQYQLESGGFAVAGGGTGTGAPSTGNTDEDYRARFYTAEEWELLTRPGNMLSPRTDRFRVADVPDGVLHRAFINDIPGLNPVTENAADVSELYHYVLENLATRQRDDPDRWIPQLATRIEVNDDHTEYHVWLKHDVLWHRPAVDWTDPRYAWLDQPHEVTADDFVFFLEVVQDPAVNAAHLRNYYEDCTGIEVIDDHEFIIVRWNEPRFQSISFTLEMMPLPRWLYGADEDGNAFEPAELGRRFNEHWYSRRGAIGNGPYQFVDWQPGGAIILERNDQYHGERPPIERIEFRVISDTTTRLNALSAGDLDYIPLQATQYQNAVLEGGTPGFANGDLVSQTYQGTAYRYLGWNADGPYFSDRRVRLAMTHAFNRELTVREHMHGLGRIVTGNFFIDGPDYNNDLEPWPFDLDRARELLDEAGWRDNDGNGIREREVNGEIIEFEFGMVTYGYRPEFVAAMETYRNDLSLIGVRMNIEPVEWAVMVERMEEKDFDAYTGGWVLGWESDPYQIWHSSQADEPHGSNRVGFRNAEADEIIETARRTFDPEERAALFHRFHEIVHEEQPYTFWFSGLEIGAWRSHVQNVNFSPLRPFDSSMNWYLAAP